MRELANEAGVATTFISDLENEVRIPLKGESIQKVAECLGFSPEKILCIAQYSKTVKLANQTESKKEDVKLALARTIITSKSLNPEKINLIMDILKEEEECLT